MRLSRREFLKWLGIGAAGAALAQVAGPAAEDVPQWDVPQWDVPQWDVPQWDIPSVPPHELLSEAHPDFQTELLGIGGNMMMITAPGSEVKANDLLVVTGDGAVKTWISGSGDDWIAIALEDARPDGLVAIDFSPDVYPEGEHA